MKVHLWLLIPPGIVTAIIYLTGAILIFETEILELGYPSRYFVKEVKGEPLSPAAMIESARQQLPDSARIDDIQVSSDPRRTYQLVLPRKKVAGFIDSYIGEVIGMDDGQDFFLKIMCLHRWLLDEYEWGGGFSWGKSIVGYVTLALATVIISGIVVWYPRSEKALRSRLKVKTKAGWFRLLYDLHVSGRFYVVLLLLISALTGLTQLFGWYRNAFYSVFGTSADPPQVHHAPTSPGVKKSAKKKTGYTRQAEVSSVLKSYYSDSNSITIQDDSVTASAARYRNTRGSDHYSFDPAMGEIMEVQLYKDFPESGRIRGWIYSIHISSQGGMTTRILTCLVSLLGTISAMAGYYSWIKKQFRKLG